MAARGAKVVITARDLSKGEGVVAAIRAASGDDAVEMEELELGSMASIRAFAEGFLARHEKLDLLINNAGVYRERWGKDPVGRIDYADWLDTFAVNTLGAMRVSEALVDSLARSERRLLVAVSSHMGSIADIGAPNDYAYRSSKAALNAAMKGVSLDLARRGIGVLILHPGWVRTRMGGDKAPLSPTESVIGMRRLIDRFRQDLSGHFYRYDGVEMPW